MFKFPENMQDVMEAAQKMQQDVAKLQSDVASKTVSASAGGGMVTVTVNGAGAVTKVAIDPTVVNASDVEMLEDLVLAATNEGLRKSKELLQEEMKKITGGLPIPGFGM